MTKPKDVLKPPLWPDQRVEQLKSLWDKGLTATEICEVMGGTRSGILGKVHRLGLDGRGPRYYPPKKPRPKKFKPEPSPNPKQKMASARAAPSAVISAPTAAPLAPIPLAHKVSGWPGVAGAIDALEEKQCRWPVGGWKDPVTGFCLHPTDSGHSYCDYHMQVARHGTPGRHNGINYARERRIILGMLLNQKKVRTAEFAGALDCMCEDVASSVSRVKGWLEENGVRMVSAAAAGYWLQPTDKHLAMVLMRHLVG